MAIDFETDAGQVRLLINDVDENNLVFPDAEITAFLAIERGSVKRAAAQCLDIIADDETLTSKAIKTQDLSTDGAKVADSLRKRATALRQQADVEDEDAAGGFFDIVDYDPHQWPPELAQWS